jgi:transcriptional regulator with XRE-family HTH domain
MAVGERLRQVREGLKKKDRRFSLRQLAERVGVTPGYLSQVENGRETPTDEKLDMLAAELGEDPGVLRILSGRLPEDLKEIVMKRPELFSQLIRQLRDAPDHAILRVVREVRDGEW